MSAHTVNLERIDPAATDKDVLNRVLVVFVARRQRGGQVVVGWYNDAEVRRSQVRQSPGKPRGYGHFCSARAGNCVLLPDANRSLEIDSGLGGMGQSNVCYPLARGGAAKGATWIQRAIRFIDDYQESNILIKPESDAEMESAAAAEKALARSKGQGFARSPEERRALEHHAMAAARRHFLELGFKVEDVSARRSYDLLCQRGSKELHVEVKGTTTDGDAIVLTNNEVKHACSSNNSRALFILHSIHLKAKKASRGKQRVFLPWKLQQKLLTPISFTYRLR